MWMRFICLFLVLCSVQVQAKDLGKEVVGRLAVNLYYATNQVENLQQLGASKKVSPAVEKQLRALKSPKFSAYRLVGNDRQPVFRSYENWLKPLGQSDELLLSFEPRGKVQGGKLLLDLEFWQSKKKIMKAGPALRKGKPLYIFGPKWRGGRLIMAIELVELMQ